MLDSFQLQPDPLPPLVLNTRACPVNSQSSIPFAAQQVGVPSPVRSILVTNFNSTTLTINSIKTTGDFTRYEQLQGERAAQNQRIRPAARSSVMFTPTASGPRTGTLTVTDSDPRVRRWCNAQAWVPTWSCRRPC